MKNRWLAAVFLSSSSVSWAAPGALDTTFDADGIVATAIGVTNDYGYSVAVQPDGKVVVAGYSFNGTDNDFALVRYNSDGSLDATFDGDGKVTTAIGAGSDAGHSVTVQSDGKIVVAGFGFTGTTYDFALVRYKSDGSLDTTFGGDGIVTTDIGASADYGRSVAVQLDGKIVVVGDDTQDFAAARYNSDGSLDTTFDGDGIVTTGIAGFPSGARAIAVQPDGKLVVAGWGRSNGIDSVFALMRYNSDGSLDTGFDGDGIVTTTIGAIGASTDVGRSITVQPDGKIVVAGESHNGTDNDFALVRYNSDGSLDTSFDADGVVTTDIGASDDYGRSVAVQPDGRLVVAGYVFNGTTTDFALARYNSDGSLDTTFDADGKVITLTGVSADSGFSTVVQPGGTLVLAGVSASAGNGDFALARYIAIDTAWDLAPVAFSFTDQGAVAVGSIRTSNTITMSGLGAGVKVPLQISGGSYSLNGGAYTTDMGWVQNGDTLTVRHTASASYSTATNTTLTIGGLVAANNPGLVLGGTVSDVFTSTTVGDAVPEPFSFTDLTAQALNSTVASDAITVSGTAVASNISITGGEYSIGCTSSFTTANGTIANGETVCVRHTTSSAYGTTVDTTLTIGGVSDIFSSTTADLDGTPDAFTFIDQTGVALDAVVESEPVMITGINGPTAVSVEGGEYSVGCTGTYTSTAGTLNDGDSVCVRHTASAMNEATVDTTLTVGGTSDVFSSTTEAAPAGGDGGSGGGGGAFDPVAVLGALAAFGLRRRRMSID